MKKQNYPILEFDSNPEAIFGPGDMYKEKEAPSKAVICLVIYFKKCMKMVN
jgi:hypothetical protein